MMKDFDGLFRYVDPLAHQYKMTATCLHINDVTKRSFVYIFEVLIYCTKPRHFIASGVLSISINTVSSISISTLYHSSIKFSPVFPISLISSNSFT